MNDQKKMDAEIALKEDGSGVELSPNNQRSFEATLNRLKKACGANSDKHLADILKINRQNIGAARKKKKIPNDWIIQIGEEFNYSLDWLKYSEGSANRLETSNQIERLKKICSVETDEEFAQFLGINSNSVQGVRERNQVIPFSWHAKISKETGYSFDWLCFESGPKKISQEEINKIADMVKKEELISSIDLVPTLDEELLEEIIAGIEDELTKYSIRPSPFNYASIISSMYGLSKELKNLDVDRTVLNEFVKNAVRLEQRKRNR